MGKSESFVPLVGRILLIASRLHKIGRWEQTAGSCSIDSQSSLSSKTK